jgi:hypothetical protein
MKKKLVGFALGALVFALSFSAEAQQSRFKAEVGNQQSWEKEL